MIRQLQHLALAFAAAFLLMALTSGYWAITQQAALLGRPDNPREILLEEWLGRASIYDRNGQVLAESVGPPGDLARHYPYPDLAPVLGYISPLYGSAGIEAAMNDVLHGGLSQAVVSGAWPAPLGARPPGRDVRLSIDLRLQAVADQALGDLSGAAIVLDAQTGEILALASHPTFDANNLQAQWETLVNDPRAPLLNRGTFALYQPGGALHPIVLADALRAGLADLHGAFPLAGAEVGVGDLRLGCRRAPTRPEINLAESFRLGCPWPFADLGGQLGADRLDQLFQDFRLYEAPALSIPTAASTPLSLAAEAPMAAIGQGRLTVTPLHVALVAAAIAHNGEMPAPQLVTGVRNASGAWEPVPAPSHPIAALAPQYANSVKALMARGHSAVALTSAGGQTLAWFSGFAPLSQSRYAVAVLLENGDVEAAGRIGRALLAKATEPGE